MAGITPFDRAVVLLPFGPWVAGPSTQEALQIVGATVLPCGVLSDEKHIRLLAEEARELGINILATTPSLACLVADALKTQGSSFNKVLTTGEDVHEGMRQFIKKSLGAELIATYAATECFIGIECRYHCGYHYDPREIYIEIVDSDTMTPSEGVGITLFTNLKAQAMPLIRYRSGDLGLLLPTPCQCGNLWPRIKWCGRTSEIFAVSSGVNVYPYQVWAALANLQGHIQHCEVTLKDVERGRDLVIFRLHVPSDNLQILKDVNQIRLSLETLSLDFFDVVQHDLVTVQVELVQAALDTGGKATLKVHDLREYAR